MAAATSGLCAFCKKDVDDELLLLCDGCNTPLHTYCVKGCLCGCGKKPPGVAAHSTTIPDGDWFCKYCAGRPPKLAEEDQPISTVYAWGVNEAGQLGIGIMGKPVADPTLVEDLRGVSIKKIVCGGWNSVVLSNDGEVYTCGDGNGGKTGHVEVQHEYLSHFAAVSVLDPDNLTGNSGKISHIAFGRDFGAAVSEHGHLYTWGVGDGGKLAHQDTNTKKYPKKVSALRETEIPLSKVLDCGWNHTVAVAAPHGGKDQFTLYGGGEVMVWGANSTGALGSGDQRGHWVPKLLYSEQKDHTLLYSPANAAPWPIKSSITSVACGKFHTLFLTDTGDVWSTGAGSQGQLGWVKDPSKAQGGSALVFGNRHTHTRPQRIEALSGKGVKSIVSSSDHCFAVTTNGQLYAWGANRSGQLGLGDTKNRWEVTLNDKLPEAVAEVATGDNHSIAVTRSGAVYTWGMGFKGQLGTGQRKSSREPVKLEKIPPMTHVAAGGDHCFAWKSQLVFSRVTASSSSSSSKRKGSKAKGKKSKKQKKQAAPSDTESEEDEEEEEEEQEEDADATDSEEEEEEKPKGRKKKGRKGSSKRRKK